MKKFLAVPFLFLSSWIYSAQFDSFGGERPAVWRSSRTAVPVSHVVISSDSSHLHGVLIGSPTANTWSYVTFANSASTGNNVTVLPFTTSTLVNTGVGTGNAFTSFYIPLDVHHSSGIVINKVGDADITILWDFTYPNRNKHIGTPRAP